MSCSYDGESETQCLLHNDNVEETQTLNAAQELNSNYTKVKKGHFSNVVNGLMIKQFRYWTSTLDIDQVELLRHKQGNGYAGLVYQSNFDYMTQLLKPDYI